MMLMPLPRHTYEGSPIVEYASSCRGKTTTAGLSVTTEHASKTSLLSSAQRTAHILPSVVTTRLLQAIPAYCPPSAVNSRVCSEYVRSTLHSTYATLCGALYDTEYSVHTYSVLWVVLHFVGSTSLVAPGSSRRFIHRTSPITYVRTVLIPYI